MVSGFIIFAMRPPVMYCALSLMVRLVSCLLEGDPLGEPGRLMVGT